jgi:hypothetical protein
MKFLKQSQLNYRNLKDQGVAVVLDGPLADPRIVLDNTNSLQLPSGTTAERPSGSVVSINGLIRYNEETNEIEVRSAGVWKRLAYKEPANIEVQIGPNTGGAVWTGNGEYNGVDLTGEIYFGPLHYSDVDGNPDGLYPAKGAIDATKPQNILVFVENVPQLANENYVLEVLDISSPLSDPLGWNQGAAFPPGVYIKFNGAVPINKRVTAIHGFDR